MRWCVPAAVVAAVSVAGSAWAQAENPDLRLRAKFTTPDNGQWGAKQSVGGADFRIHSRFLQLYYGGVSRSDDFKFSVSVDFRSLPGFAAEFASSPYNTDFDVYINNACVGRLYANASVFGVAELQYDSRHPSPPALPLPPDFPEPVGVFDTVRVFVAAPILPAIGEPLPAGVPVFIAELLEQFARGDVNQDKKVNLEDFAFLAANYDPYNLIGPHIGPVAGDFTGDNRTDHADYELFVQNWTEKSDPPGEPEPVVTPSCLADFNLDGFVNGVDFDAFTFEFYWGTSAADFDSNGFVNGDDFDSFVLAFEAGC